MLAEVARPEDDVDIRRLLREVPLDGAIRLTLEREPDSFAGGAIQGDTHQVIAVREGPGGALLGFGSRSILEAWVNGRSARIGYLSQLRVDGRRARTGFPLLRGYALLRELHRDGAVPFYVTTIVEDNTAARRVLEACLPSMPRYQLLGRLVTLVLPVHRVGRTRRAEPSRERGSRETLPEIADFLDRNGSRRQFAPRWTLARLLSTRRCRGLRAEDFIVARRSGRIVGCLARWDQRAFKQTVVRSYGARLRLLRPVINAAGPWIGVPRLPSPGTELRSAFLSHVAVEEDDPGTFLALLEDAFRDAAGTDVDCLVLGFSEDHPLLPVTTGFVRGRRYRSLLYAVHWEDGAEAVRSLDGRVPHLEVAIL